MRWTWNSLFIDPDLVIPDQNLSLAQGAVAPWSDRSSLTTNRPLLRLQSILTLI